MTIATERLIGGTILEEQIALETQAVEDGIKRYRALAREAVERGDGAALKPAERFLLHWYEPLLEVLKQDRRKAKSGKVAGHGQAVYGPILRSVSPEKLAVITIRVTLGKCMREPDGVKFTHLVHAIGADVFAEYGMDLMRKGHKDTVKEMDRRFKKLNTKRVNWFAKKTLTDENFMRQAYVWVGSRLFWHLQGVASADDYDKPFRQAFHKETRRHKKNGKPRQTGYVNINPEVLDIIADGHTQRELLRPRYLPMIVPPYRWSPESQGGYIRIRTPFISNPTRTQKDILAGADLSRVYDCLHAVGVTPWRVNERILEVMKEVWDTGGDLAGVPRGNNWPKPPQPADFNDPDQKKQWKREAWKVHTANKRLAGARCEFLNKIAVADRMAGRPIYFPHRLDFRGRAYPIPIHLNHQGDDVCRGLLEFSEAKAPDERWLKIHAANMYGMDKLPYDKRVEWADRNMHQIKASAEEPLFDPTWRCADKPWQFLAACMALTFEDAAAHLPVQMDGTCNGLQHYAALGRDAEGASVVNMMPGDEPTDIYSIVAERVKRLVAQDTDPRARMVEDYITRAVIKQPVMTSVYGVTMAGAKQQIRNRLTEAGLSDDPLFKGSLYLANVTLEAIRQTCTSAREIMDWLQESARIIVSETGQTLWWTTPLGFPVVQPYRNWRKHQVFVVGGHVYLEADEPAMPPKLGKQVDGAAPNFVHSIDATHMMMAAKACQDAGVTFAAVHDSYWTHSSHADELGSILRREFVGLHGPCLLNILADEWNARYRVALPDLPTMGDYDIRIALQAPYMFS